MMSCSYIVETHSVISNRVFNWEDYFVLPEYHLSMILTGCSIEMATLAQWRDNANAQDWNRPYELTCHMSLQIKSWKQISGYPNSGNGYCRVICCGCFCDIWCIYTVPALMVVSVRYSGLLWKVTLCTLSWQRMNIKRETLGATSGPRVFLGRSWW